MTVDLIPNGRNIEVSESNKVEYVQKIVEWRILKRVESQINAFMTGFFELVPKELISVFDERELEVSLSI